MVRLSPVSALPAKSLPDRSGRHGTSPSPLSALVNTRRDLGIINTPSHLQSLPYTGHGATVNVNANKEKM